MPDEAATGTSTPASSPAATPAQNKLDTLQANQANVAMAGSMVYHNTRLIVQFNGSHKGKDVGGKGKRWSLSGNKLDDLKHNKYGQALHADPSAGFPLDEEPNIDGQIPKNLPETVEDVRIWYRALNPVEKCFIQAMSMLSGAPEHQIRSATSILYQPIIEAEEKRQQAKQRQILPSGEEPSIPPIMPHFSLDTQFLARTYTILSKFDRARRLFWQDTQGNSVSPFSILVLTVIQQEVPLGGSYGQVGQNLLERLEELPKALGGESSWRVPRALGSLWLEADEKRLRWMADTWAQDLDSDDPWGWRVAHLLEGAFTSEYNQLGQKAYLPGQSAVLSLLYEWIETIHNDALDPISIRLGCAVAMTYRLLGAQHLQVAFTGLDALLHFPLPEDEEEGFISEDVLIATVSAYAVLASYGSSREVLKKLAEYAERFSHRRQDRNNKNGYREIHEYRIWRFITLFSVINTFSLLAGSSLGPLQKDKLIPYSIPASLTTRPILPDEGVVDMLLTGILASGETNWREHICIILCAVFVEDNDLALAIMRSWAEEVLEIRGPGALRARRTYLDFVVMVLHRSEQWYHDLRQSGYDLRNTIHSATRTFLRWKMESQHPPHPLGAFAEDILRQIQKP